MYIFQEYACHVQAPTSVEKSILSFIELFALKIEASAKQSKKDQ